MLACTLYVDLGKLSLEEHLDRDALLILSDVLIQVIYNYKRHFLTVTYARGMREILRSKRGLSMLSSLKAWNKH